MVIFDRAAIFMIVLVIGMFVDNAEADLSISPVPVAQCCGLKLRFEIQHYPRYSRRAINHRPRLIVSASRARDLLMPALDEGGYRLTFEPVALIAGRHYRLSVDMQSVDKVRLTAEVFAGTHKVASTSKGVTGEGMIILPFTARKGPVTRNGEAVHVLKLWVHGKADVVLKKIALTEENGAAMAAGTSALILPDSALGVYDTRQSGEMRLLPVPEQTVIDYTIEQLLPEKTVLKKVSLAGHSSEPVRYIPLKTGHSGYFLVDVRLKSKDGQTSKVSRHYVVIDPVHRPPSKRRFYGMCTEEEGLTDFIPAAVSADEIYQLLKRMGVGSVRMFNPAMPNELSRDGSHYDFNALDAAISTAHRYGMEILLELGSNNLSRLPAWLLSAIPGNEKIDLRRGMRFDYQKQAFKAKGYDKTPYLDLKEYRAYLEQLFIHIRGRVRNFEIWNEPGHKFLAVDFVRIARITRDVQKRYAPGSRLVGFSSTAYPGFGIGRNKEAMPGFLMDMLLLGGGDLVDVVSYHSRHAFNFLGRRNQSDPRTDYVPRITKMVMKYGYGHLPVWDTERGVPWSSQTDVLDRYDMDVRPVSWLKPFDALEPARQLPKIFSQAVTQNVQRVYWFNLLPGTENIARTQIRESLFDVGIEPTATIFEYAAWYVYGEHDQ